MSTLRSQLHEALAKAEIARTNRDRACDEADRACEAYHDVREQVDNLIDRLAPIDKPNGTLTTEDVRAFLTGRKIGLIKLVREATIQHVRKLRERDAIVGMQDSAMGLKEAKDLVDEWIADQYERSSL